MVAELGVSNAHPGPTSHSGEPAMAEGDRRWLRNEAHALILLCAMGALMGYCGWIVAGDRGIVWSVLLGLALLAMIRHVSSDGVVKALRGRPLLGSRADVIAERLAALSKRAGLQSVPRLYHAPGELPLALSLGDGDTAAIIVTDPLLQDLVGDELVGVLAHELIHLRNGDILLMQWGLVLGWVTRIVSQVGCVLLLIGLAANALSLVDYPLKSLVFLVFAPLLSTLLRLALSRDREAEADAEAAELTQDPDALASALIKLRERRRGTLKRLFPTVRSLHLPTLLADHPPTEERIRRLQQFRHRDAV